MVRKLVRLPADATVMDACEFFIQHRLLALHRTGRRRRRRTRRSLARQRQDRVRSAFLMSAEAYPQYPVNLRLNGVQCLVVGGAVRGARRGLRMRRLCHRRRTDDRRRVVHRFRVRWHPQRYRQRVASSRRHHRHRTDVDGQVFEDAKATGIPSRRRRPGTRPPCPPYCAEAISRSQSPPTAAAAL
jgi:hypothetical protein